MRTGLFTWNYWYASRPDEIFLDLDSNRATARALSVLRLALRKRDLPIKAVWLYSTLTPHHAHMIIQLNMNLTVIEKMAWSLWLGNDRLRVAYVLGRYEKGIIYSGDLLVSRTPYFRKYDALCLCTEKHKEPAITDTCTAMETLLGDERSADYFTRTGSAPPRRKIRVPWGRIRLSQLRRWREVYEREERLLQDHGNVGKVSGLARGTESPG